MIDKDKREKFDIERFEKNKDENNKYCFIDEEGYSVMEKKPADYYWQGRRKLDELFQEYYKFYADGSIAEKGMQYYNFFLSGIWYEYDKKGKLIKTLDREKPYKNYPWEKFRALLEDEYKLDLFNPAVTISRYILDEKFPKWRAFFGLPNNSPQIIVDVNTGEVQYEILQAIE